MADEKISDVVDPTQIGIYYQRSRHYRTVHADGAQLGVTPRGGIQFRLFSDQKPFPDFVMHRITAEGNLGEPIEEVIKEGAIREVDVNVVMDINTAISFASALQQLLTQISQLQEQSASKVTPKSEAQPQVSE